MQFLGGAVILAGVTLVRVGELRPAPEPGGRGESGAHAAELSGDLAGAWPD